MPFSRWLLTASLATLASFAAAAQEAPPPAGQPPEKQAPGTGLSDLNRTVDELLREEGQPAGQSPAATEPAEATPPPAAEPAPTEAPPAEAEAQAPPAPPARAQVANAEPPALTREQLAALERTVERGQLLINIARAGIVATQDMLTRLSDPGGAGIAGWIAETAGNSTQVTFYSEGAGGAAPRAVYRATVLGGRVTSREIFLGADRPALTPVQARMAAARTASETDELRACTTQPFNVLVVPPASPRAPVDVYRISAPAGPGRFPLGGHYRSTVAAGGTVETHAFADTCADAQPPAVAAGAQPRPIGAGRINDPMPTEVQMLLAQEIGRPLLVTTDEPRRIWLVTPDRIAELRRQESAGR